MVKCMSAHLRETGDRVYIHHPRQLIFLRKCDCLGCVVLLCLVVCLTCCFFLPSFFFSH